MKLHQDQLAQILDALRSSLRYVETCREPHGQDQASKTVTKIKNALAWFDR